MLGVNMSYGANITERPLSKSMFFINTLHGAHTIKVGEVL